MDVGIDIGNSNVTLGFKIEDKWIGMWRMPTVMEAPFMFYRKRWIDELLESTLDVGTINQVCISSVVPDLTDAIVEVAKEVFSKEPNIVSTRSSKIVDINIHNRDQLGLDLYANAVAAFDRCRQAVVVVDFGTALTFTSVDHQGVIQGVAIVPGLKTAMKALSGNTAQLPEVDLQTPPSPIGKNTSEAIRAGILYGYVGLVKHMIAETKTVLGDSVKCIATGGLSKTLPLLEQEFDNIDESLTLNGIILIGRELESMKSQSS